MQKILIIEDDPYVRRFYGRLFSFEKYQVEMAANGEEGIELAKKNKPDLILLDIMMPVMNGMEVLAKLVGDPETKDCPVVMLTVLGDEETIQKAKDLGAKGYIVKSDAEPKDLLAKIESFLKPL